MSMRLYLTKPIDPTIVFYKEQFGVKKRKIWSIMWNNGEILPVHLFAYCVFHEDEKTPYWYVNKWTGIPQKNSLPNRWIPQ